MIAVGGDEHLRLVVQAAKGDRMDDAVAIALKLVARPAHNAAGLTMIAPARRRGIAGARRDGHVSGSTRYPLSLIKNKPLTFASLIITTHARQSLRPSHGATTRSGAISTD